MGNSTIKPEKTEKHRHTGNCRCVKTDGMKRHYDMIKNYIIGKTVEEARKLFSSFIFIITDDEVKYNNYFHVSVDENDKITTAKYSDFFTE